MKKQFEESELPLKELEKLGLCKGGKHQLNQNDLDALLYGRRTDFITLKNMKKDDFTIDRIDVKLSLERNAAGQTHVKMHPIHKRAYDSPLLTAAETERLKTGKQYNAVKPIVNARREKETAIIEYDEETREFISTNAKDIIPPNEVDGQPLTANQQEAYKKGNTVELENGTQLRHTGKNAQGLISNRAALVLSLILDGGISYLIIKGIKNFNGRKSTSYSEGYEAARKDIELKRQGLLEMNPKHSKGKARGR